jgi:hypothetical protein
VSKKYPSLDARLKLWKDADRALSEALKELRLPHDQNTLDFISSRLLDAGIDFTRVEQPLP